MISAGDAGTAPEVFAHGCSGRGPSGIRHVRLALQVETPVVPSFEAALGQADWAALHDQRRAEAEAARKVRGGSPHAAKQHLLAVAVPRFAVGQPVNCT